MAVGNRCFRLGLVTLALWLGGGSVSFADMPTDQVKDTVGRVVTILRDPALATEDKIAERREALRQVILPRFDFSEMARRSLGSRSRLHARRMAKRMCGSSLVKRSDDAP